MSGLSYDGKGTKLINPDDVLFEASYLMAIDSIPVKEELTYGLLRRTERNSQPYELTVALQKRSLLQGCLCR